ncbi:MAG: methyltransferase domain-containing protein [Anaerolineales bacterium]|nr:methyltransferase domain-containing protein [Anaerolineales bacterium]
MTTFTWNAADYAKSSAVQQRWARELIAKMDLQGNEHLLDLGCGDGKVTAEIASVLSNGYVMGVDSSSEMIELAKSLFTSGEYPNLSFQVVDALNLNFHNEFDVVFSNAVLHWVADHPSVLRGVSDSLKPNGKILFQMGGRGNAAQVITAMDEIRSAPEWLDYFIGFQFPYSFYGTEEYTHWLPAAGFVPLRMELIPKDMAHVDRSAFEGWLRTTWLPYIRRVPEEKHQEFLKQVVDLYLTTNPPSSDGIIHVQMIRLEVEAKKE